MESQTTDVAEQEKGARSELSFGLMRINGALLALHVQSIREVVPGRPVYTPLPAWTEGLLGGFDLRGSVIPVFDLRGSLGMTVSPLVDHVILIMRWQGRLLGLVADSVCGMAHIAPESLFTLDAATHDRRPRLVTHTFEVGEDIASLLDASRIAALPNLPTVAERAVGQRQNKSQRFEQILLFTCGQLHFGIEATCVDATVPRTRLERNALAGGYCMGIIDHHGYEVAVVDTAAALGLDGPSSVAETSVLVLRFAENAMLGFAIKAVEDIARVAEHHILPMPSASLGGTPLFRGMLMDDKGVEHLVLDIANIRLEPQFMTLAALRKPRIGLRPPDAALGATARAAGRKTVSFLTFVAGPECATPIADVTEILVFPTQIAPFSGKITGMVGLFTYKGAAVPLVHLAARHGRSGTFDPAQARVLVVNHDGASAGFIVDALRSIEAAQWNSPKPDLDDDEPTTLGALVLVGLGDTRRMVTHVDLIHELRTLSRTTASKTKAIAPRGGGIAPRLDKTG